MERHLKDTVLELRRVERRLGRELPQLMRDTGTMSRRKLAQHIARAEACMKQLERELKR